jgi:hypothetical protein
MDLYREESRLKHEKYREEEAKKLEKERREAEQKLEAEQRREAEKIREEEQCEIEKRELWMTWCSLLEEDCIMALTELENMIPWMEKEQVQTYMVDLIRQMNEIHERKKIDAYQANEIRVLFSRMIELAELDIDIETMDTTQDEEFAIELQTVHDEELARQLQQEPILEQMPEPIQNVPICSIERRMGLTLIQLKEIARTYNLPTSGNKRDLCLLLSDRGLVRIV